MGADRLFAEIKKARIPGTEGITLNDCQRMVRAWRSEHRATELFWSLLNTAAMSAVNNPGVAVRCRSVAFKMVDDILFLRLPSGRKLSYPSPVIKPGRFGWDQISFDHMEAGRRKGTQLNGGLICENTVQAFARDLLAEAMKRLAAAEYEIIMHSHDEITAEMPVGVGSVEEFERIMTEVPSWAEGLPIAAEVFECDRFKKG